MNRDVHYFAILTLIGGAGFLSNADSGFGLVMLVWSIGAYSSFREALLHSPAGIEEAAS